VTLPFAIDERALLRCVRGSEVVRMRGAYKIGVLVLAATSLGATCTPPDTVKIEIRRLGVTPWQRDVTRDTTHGWMEEGLWPIVPALSSTSATWLTVNEPGDALELFVLNRGPEWSPTLPIPRVDPSTRFASHRSATTFTSTIGSTEDIKAARLVDHGACARIAPWIQGPNKDNVFGPPTAETQGIFRTLDDAITNAFRARAGVIAVVKVLDVFQASFSKDAGVSVYNTVDVDDGFAMHIEFTFAARLNVQPYQVANVAIDADLTPKSWPSDSVSPKEARNGQEEQLFGEANHRRHPRGGGRGHAG